MRIVLSKASRAYSFLRFNTCLLGWQSCIAGEQDIIDSRLAEVSSGYPARSTALQGSADIEREGTYSYRGYFFKLNIQLIICIFVNMTFVNMNFVNYVS